MSIESTLRSGKGPVTYPDDHVPGIRVPKGGSCCCTCKYLVDEDRRICGNRYFIKWNGSPVIPGKTDEYCSDWYEPRKGALS